jgi:hypothetical protein
MPEIRGLFIRIDHYGRFFYTVSISYVESVNLYIDVPLNG